MEQVGIYVRLSQEDLQKDLSSSIVNQIEFIKKYLYEKNMSYKKIYIDDGFSGGNFDRPGFKQMMEDINDGFICCIVVKDLSRLGRNYLEVGKYLEEIFPKKKIRFISINDNYDSINNVDFMLALRNYLNNLYLRECEKKSRQQIKRRCLAGNISPFGQYGYQKNKKNQLIIDPEAAKIVQRIYSEFIEGLSVNEIAKRLTEEKIINPGYYRYLRLGRKSSMEGIVTKPEYNPYYWSAATIKKILADEEYTGVAINRPYTRERSKSLKRVTPYRLENTQEAIISVEVFNQAKLQREQHFKKIKKSNYNRLDKKVYCSKCNELSKFTLRYYVSKKGRKDISSYTCPICKNKILASVLHKALFQDVIDVLQNIKKDYFKSIFKTNQFREVSKEIYRSNNIELEYELLFDKRVSESISEEEYEKKLNELVTKSKNFGSIKKEYPKESLTSFKYDDFIEFVNTIRDENTLFNIMDMLITRVNYFNEDKKINLNINYFL